MTFPVHACTHEPCNYVVGSINPIEGKVEFLVYDYLLNEDSVYAFLSMFLILFVVTFLQGIYFRTWWTLPTLVLGVALEASGWGGRLWSLKTTFWDPSRGGQWDLNDKAFTMQICLLIFAPVFFSACNYIYLPRLLEVTGVRYSSVTPKSMAGTFIVGDILCIAVQGFGGGVAGGGDDRMMFKAGMIVMGVGIVAQLALAVLFSGLLIEFIYRYFGDNPTYNQYNIVGWLKCCCCFCPTKRKSMGDIDEKDGAAQRVAASNLVRSGVTVLVFTTLLIVVRGFFRCVEMLTFTPAGQAGPALRNQNLFIGLDGVLMLLLVIAYIVYPPGFVVGNRMF